MEAGGGAYEDGERLFALGSVLNIVLEARVDLGVLVGTKETPPLSAESNGDNKDLSRNDERFALVLQNSFCPLPVRIDEADHLEPWAQLVLWT